MSLEGHRFAKTNRNYTLAAKRTLNNDGSEITEDHSLNWDLQSGAYRLAVYRLGTYRLWAYRIDPPIWDLEMH